MTLMTCVLTIMIFKIVCFMFLFPLTLETTLTILYGSLQVKQTIVIVKLSPVF